MPKKKIYRKEECGGGSIIEYEDAPVLSKQDLISLFNNETGLGSYKSTLVVQTVVDLLEKILAKGAGLDLGNKIRIEPVLITDYVEEYAPYVMRVIPEHKSFMVKTSSIIEKQDDDKPFYVIHNSSERLTYSEAIKRRNAIYGARNA